MQRIARIAVSWWPIAAFLAVALIAQQLVLGRYYAVGHAGDHLSSAGVLFPMNAVLGVILWVSLKARRSPGVWMLGGVLLAGLLIVMKGNLEVVDAIGTENWTDEQAGIFGDARPGFTSGHDLASTGSLITIGSALLMIGLMMLQKTVRPAVGIAAFVMCVLCPPWIIPGFGLVVVAIAVCVTRARVLESTRL